LVNWFKLLVIPESCRNIIFFSSREKLGAVTIFFNPASRRKLASVSSACSAFFNYRKFFQEETHRDFELTLTIFTHYITSIFWNLHFGGLGAKPPARLCRRRLFERQRKTDGRRRGLPGIKLTFNTPGLLKFNS